MELSNPLSRHETEIGVRFAGPDKLVHLIGAGVKWRCVGGEGMSAWTGPGRSAKASATGTNSTR